LIYGRFGDTSGRPYLEARLALPHQNRWRLCPFIIDTGAERSVLMPTDSRLMGVDRSGLQRDATDGIGGHCDGYNSFAFIILHDEETSFLHNFRINVFIPDESPDLFRIDSSILGRDVLDRLRLVYDKPNNRVTLDNFLANERIDAKGWNSPRLRIR